MRGVRLLAQVGLLTILLQFGCSLLPEKTKPKPIRPAFLEHEVAYPGENLNLIAEWYTGSSANWREISKYNKGIRMDGIRPGQTIKIPYRLIVRETPMPDPQRRLDSWKDRPELRLKGREDLEDVEVDESEPREIVPKLSPTRAPIIRVTAAPKKPTPREATPRPSATARIIRAPASSTKPPRPMITERPANTVKPSPVPVSPKATERPSIPTPAPQKVAPTLDPQSQRLKTRYELLQELVEKE